MIRALVISLALLLAPMVHAQVEDRSRIVRFIEEALSDGARTVRIEGFAGALSSTATLDRLTIADEDGIWLTIEGAELVWTRSALLSGRLEVDRLRADRVVLDRLPPSGGSAPAPEATPFELPELPVAISLGELAIDRIELGAALLGFPVTATASGTARLEDGEGAANLSLDRLDGPRGSFALDAAYSNATGLLDLSLLLEEDAGGIAATVLSLPGDPSVALELAGAGPLDDLTVDLSLATDGQPRLSGQIVSARDSDGAQQVTADLSGDLTPLMAAEYRPFFGTDTALEAVISRPEEGGTVLEDFTLRSFAFSLTGSGAMDAGGAPLRFAVEGLISDPSAAPVRLPIPGMAVTLASADLTIGYDRAAGDEWTAEAQILTLEAEGAAVERATLSASGTITPPETGPVAVTFAAETDLTGLSHESPALQDAVGPFAQLSLAGDWRAGAPFRLTRLDAETATAALSGTASLTVADNRLLAETDLNASLPDLAPFSALAGETLSGGASMSVAAEGELLSGAFDAAAELIATDLRYGTGLPPALLAGETRLETALSRDETGLTLETFTLSGSTLSASASGRLSSANSALEATARLTDAGLFTTALSGPVEATAALTREGEDAPWIIDADASGRGGLTARITGQAGLPGGAVDLALTGRAPLALADRFITPQSLRGTADFDLALDGAPGLPALSGSITTSDARVSAPDAGIVLEGVDLTARLQGADVSLSGGARVQAGGNLSFDGLVTLSDGLPGRIDMALSAVRIAEDALFETVVDRGDITLRGRLAEGPLVTGNLILGQTDIRLDELSFGAAEPIPAIRHVGESGGQYVTRDRAGLTAAQGGPARPVALDLTIAAPSRIFLRGSGLDAELGGEIRLGGTSAAVLPSGQFNLIRGRLSFLGQRFDLTEATATLQGGFDPFLRVVAETQAEQISARVTIEGPASEPVLTVTSVPDLPQDEILARLFFGRSATSLSPVQALQLVDAVSGAAGGQGLIGGLRNRFGLADLDLTTSSEGDAQLRIGRYLSENIYTDVQVGTGGTAEASVNIDLTPQITARGTVTTDGESSLGVFYERDY